MTLRLTGDRQEGDSLKPADPAALSAEDAERAFAADFARLQGPAATYARKRLGSLWADDVVQESFLALWRAYYSKGKLPRENAERVFYRVLRRRILERRERERGREVLDDQHTIDIVHQQEPMLDAARVADGSVLAGRIEYMLGFMPDTTAKVFRAVWKNDWDVAAAAEELSIPYHTTRGHFLRAKHRLAESLGEEGYSVPKLIPRGRDGGKKQ